jgi:uncharacterized protein
MKLFLNFLLLLSSVSFSAESLLERKNFNFCGRKVNLEIAKTDAQRERGLMNRDSLEKDAGMLFVFRNATAHSFWMKNVRIPLDIAFLDARGKIVKIHTMAIESPMIQDHRRKLYPSEKPSKFAVELIGGSLKDLTPKEIASCVLRPLPVIDHSVE